MHVMLLIIVGQLSVDLKMFSILCRIVVLHIDAAKGEAIQCPLGYTGLNCSMECRYPGYGKSCQEQCNCSQELCDISTGCPDSPQNDKMLRDINSTESERESKNPNSGSQLTVILTGVVSFLALLVFIVAGRITWKRVKQYNPRMVQRKQGLGNLEKESKRRTENEGTIENFYEDMDENNRVESKKECLLPSENDYIETLTFPKKKNESDNRESSHFYDALK
ncbi:uncharacterized protein LOC134258149 [Saccostrea cucullata]|uniref:uncharacterized protein LOC134258149 n=1 Tax=Saccostrea cuccullata TaxID=36930 RepID=UPI002ED650A8